LANFVSNWFELAKVGHVWWHTKERDLVKLDSFGNSLSRGKTTPKQAVVDIHAIDPEVPHMRTEQVQNLLAYERHKALGPGNNVDQLVSVLKNDKVKPYLLYPIQEKDFPAAEKSWQIVLASNKLLNLGSKYGKEIIGMDSRWKNTDIRCPLTVLSAACKGRKVFPISVMISGNATTQDYLRLLNATSLEIDQRLDGEEWDPCVMIDHCSQERDAIISVLVTLLRHNFTFVNSILIQIGLKISKNVYLHTC